MNIGLLTNFLALSPDADSGIGQHYRILADTLARAGHRVHIVHPSLKPEKARVLIAALSPNWSCDIVPATPPAWLMQVFRWSWPTQELVLQLWAARSADRALARACRLRQLQIIETHAYEAPAVLFLRRSQRPKVVTRVSTTMGQMVAISSVRSRVKHWQAALERRATRLSDALVTHTRQHCDALCLIDGHAPERFTLIPHGLPDPGEPSPPDTASRLVFLFVGRFETRKGIDVLLAAIPEVAAAFPQAVFRLAGSPGDGTAWRSFANRHPELAATRVELLGQVSSETLASLYRECTVLVAPSRYESFGLIYVEAMSHAKPVIGCAAGGIPEVVRDGVTGLLAQPGDVPSLVACMCRLAADADLRTRLGEAGRREFLTRFSAETMAQKTVAYYQSLLSPGAS